MKQLRINNQYTLNAAISELTDLDLNKDWLISIRPYKRDRSLEFNALSHVWYAQVAAKEREYTAGQVKGFCKLHFGIPILRTDSEFGELYDRIFKPMPYEMKLEIMSTPGLFDVTSLMKTDQMSLYMDHIQHYYADRVQLLYPGEPPGY